MKKIFSYHFIPTKDEEEAAKASKTPFQVSRDLVEIRDLHPPPPPPPGLDNAWRIRKRLTTGDVLSGRLTLSYNDTFEHIFRHWSIEMVNYVVMGSKAPVVVWDLTNENQPIGYKNIFLEKGCHDEFCVIGLMDLISNRIINPGDEIGMCWNVILVAFQFKLLHREI